MRAGQARIAAVDQELRDKLVDPVDKSGDPDT
jgi:hypothetical protein